MCGDEISCGREDPGLHSKLGPRDNHAPAGPQIIPIKVCPTAGHYCPDGGHQISPRFIQIFRQAFVFSRSLSGQLDRPVTHGRLADLVLTHPRPNRPRPWPHFDRIFDDMPSRSICPDSRQTFFGLGAPFLSGLPGGLDKYYPGSWSRCLILAFW